MTSAHGIVQDMAIFGSRYSLTSWRQVLKHHPISSSVDKYTNVEALFDNTEEPDHALHCLYCPFGLPITLGVTGRTQHVQNCMPKKTNEIHAKNVSGCYDFWNTISGNYFQHCDNCGRGCSLNLANSGNFEK